MGAEDARIVAAWKIEQACAHIVLAGQKLEEARGLLGPEALVGSPLDALLTEHPMGHDKLRAAADHLRGAKA